MRATLLGGGDQLTLADLAREAGVEEDQARLFWRTLGFADPPADRPLFTSRDVEALVRVRDLVVSGAVDLRTAVSLTRALGHTSDRLALWQAEALVEDTVRRRHLDDADARLHALRALAELAPVLEAQMVHSWRRQLAALAGRWATEFGAAGERQADRDADHDRDDALPLWRAIGFADLVSFTEHTARLGSHELAAFVQRFETAARDVVTAAGGRVVKTIGDAVLFVADDVSTGAHVALGLAREVGARRAIPPVRVSLVWGRVLSRFGDVFGPSVNVAARLSDEAEPGTVLTDAPTARLLAEDVAFELVEQPERDVPGLGPLAPVQVRPRQD